MIKKTPFQNTQQQNNPQPPAQSHFPQAPKPSQQSHQAPPKPYTNPYPLQKEPESDFEVSKNIYESTLKQYNCSPEFITTTTSVFPANANQFKDLSVPIGLFMSPGSNLQTEFPLVNYEEKDIPRCSACRAYLNPFVTFVQGGDNWICNICKNNNKTADYYYADLDNNGKRVDADSKIELCNGSYEFVTNEKYYKQGRDPVSAMFIFLIETSMSAIVNNYLSAVLESIKDVINNESFYNGPTTKCAFITYDSSVHFYSFSEKGTQPQMLCVSSDPIFLPTVKENLIFEVQKDKDKILNILDSIQNGFTTNSCKDSDKIFDAITGAYLIGKQLGGAIVVFSSSNIIGKLPKMNGGNDPKMPAEQKPYACTDSKQLGNLGINCTNENMSISVFATAENQINLVTLNALSDYSNGNFYFYKKFRFELHYKNLFNQIRRALTRPICWECVLRTRFSHGYCLSDFLTPVLISNQDLFVFPTYDPDQHFQVAVKIKTTEEGGKTNPTSKDNFLYIQSALLYSYGDGTRRIRIHNLCVPLSSRAKDIYDGINGEAVANYYLKSTIDKIYKRKNISNEIFSTESFFKTLIASAMSTKSLQSEISDNLIYLPLYILGMMKHRAFCKDEIERKYDLDLSNYLRIKLQKMSIEESLCYLYPHIFPLHQLLYDDTLGRYNEESTVNMPNIVSATMESLEPDGVYLIDNGFMLIIYVRKADEKIIKSLFGVEDVQFITENINEETVFNNMDELKERIMNIIDYIRSTKALFQNLIFVFEGTEGERV